MIIVMIPLMIAAGIFTHITARHSVARQTAAQGDNPQTAIMNKLMLYVFPIGVVVGAPFLPLAVLIYWVANNLWTLGQQYVVYRRIDAEESEKKDAAVASQQARAPRPGQKPVRPEQPHGRRPTPTPPTPAATGQDPGREAGDPQEPGNRQEPGDRCRPGEAGRRVAQRCRPRGGTPPPPAANPRRTVFRPAEGRASGARSGGARPPARRGRKRR